MNLAEKWLSMICLKIEKISFTVGYSFYQFKHILPEIQMFLQRSHSDKISGFTVSSPPHKLATTKLAITGVNSPLAAIWLKRYV